jgi:hypothetical protein
LNMMPVNVKCVYEYARVCYSEHTHTPAYTPYDCTVVALSFTEIIFSGFVNCTETSDTLRKIEYVSRARAGDRRECLTYQSRLREVGERAVRLGARLANYGHVPVQCAVRNSDTQRRRMSHTHTLVAACAHVTPPPQHHAYPSNPVVVTEMPGDRMSLYVHYARTESVSGTQHTQRTQHSQPVCCPRTRTADRRLSPGGGEEEEVCV